MLPEYERQMILAGRTNLLVPGLNFGVEIPVGRHFSIGADYWYPWWLAKSNKYCGEMLGIGLQVETVNMSGLVTIN